MAVEGLLIWLVIGALAGWIAGEIFRGAGFGLVGNIVVGIIGAVVAGFLLPALGLSFGTGNPFVTNVLYGVIGGVISLFVISMVRRSAAHV